ncbi:MAG TPA: hypothetical protein VE197_14980, partial [Mycobacterium sp.]|nr:hypothetical protein [Mycobacterium sp.]
MHAQLPSHLCDRLARLPNNPDRALPELSIEISPFHRHHFLKATSLRYEGKPMSHVRIRRELAA